MSYAASLSYLYVSFFLPFSPSLCRLELFINCADSWLLPGTRQRRRDSCARATYLPLNLICLAFRLRGPTTATT